MEFYDIGEVLKKARKEKKLTQNELAIQVGITRQTLAKMEKGLIDKVSLQLFIKILEVLDKELHIEDKKPFYYFDSKGL
jgi:transcriptional regulator with XRE-family HTH domain